MLEIRWHGRGGQGAVTSGEMLTLAAIEEDKYGQGFPMFGPGKGEALRLLHSHALMRNR